MNNFPVTTTNEQFTSIGWIVGERRRKQAKD